MQGPPHTASMVSPPNAARGRWQIPVAFRTTRATVYRDERRRCARTFLFAAVAVMFACSPPVMPGADARLQVADLLGGADTLHARALAPREFRFPEDHGAHPEFRTEWWYFTGNVTADDGHELGYQLTFFRSALTDSVTFVAAIGEGNATSDWRSRHAYMAHFAVTDITGGRFTAAERFGRAGLGLAGARAVPFRVWLEPWSAEGGVNGMFPLRLKAADGDIEIDLVLEQGKPIVLQGDGGLSAKGAEPGNASYYYSLTRMPTAGTIRSGGRTHRVTGTSWLDREWSTSVLAEGIEGWDWLSLQLDDGTELMLYRLRRDDGGTDPFSAGTFIAATGATTPLDAASFTLEPRSTWRSPVDGTPYPVSWRITVPVVGIALDVRAAVEAQELNLAVRYWEGAVRVEGVREGRPIRGRGYLEMTGH